LQNDPQDIYQGLTTILMPKTAFLDPKSEATKKLGLGGFCVLDQWAKSNLKWPAFSGRSDRPFPA
ncbi:MAG: hypothetical protein PHE10_07460, partial [Kiritimatiellae bacterium]|nr:hypothetical protein [Kiritimatiellia bacterium]